MEVKLGIESVPSGLRILYAFPEMEDFEAMPLMKSSAVFTLSPALPSFIRRWLAAAFVSYSVPLRMKTAPL